MTTTYQNLLIFLGIGKIFFFFLLPSSPLCQNVNICRAILFLGDAICSHKPQNFRGLTHCSLFLVLITVAPNLFGIRDWFRGRQFFRGCGGMFQAVMWAMGSGPCSFARLPTAQLLLCGPVPNRLRTGPSLRPGGWGTLLIRLRSWFFDRWFSFIWLANNLESL